MTPKFVKLSEISQIESGGTPSSDNPNYWNGDINWVTLVDVKNKYVTSTKRKITAEGLKNSSAKVLPVGTVLFSSRATIGEVSIVNIELATNQGFKNFICDLNKIIPEYLYFVLKFEAKKIANSVSSTTFKEISKSKLGEYKIPLPPIEEQRLIVSMLNKADDLRQKRKQAIVLLDEYLTSTFLEMFGNPAINPKKWQKRPLNEFGAIITGNTPSRSDLNHFSSKHIEWIKTDNILNDEIYISTANEYLSESGLSKGRSANTGSLLVACIAGSFESIGRAGLTNRTVSFNQQINAIQPFDSINSIFLYWLFKNSKKYIQEHATKGMKKILTKGAFQKIEMIMPPIEVQNKFAEIADKQEQIKQKMLSQSIEINNQFKALMQKAFN